jgi:nephrocystin-3
MAAPSELRVFISSTFRDLQDEREHLVKKIFPEIRALCRERGITFTEVDLRWGITDDERHRGEVIGTCLGEVDRCRPHFIGILGSRYGWVPTRSEVEADHTLFERYPWMDEAVDHGLSLTEMEFVAGIFTDEGAGVGGLVYRRGSDDEEPGIARLAARTSAARVDVRNFRDASELGALVRTDMLALVDRIDPADEAPSPLTLERRAHASFAASRLHGYVERRELRAAFDEWMSVGMAPLLVTAGSGLGKSSLIAALASGTRVADSDAFVVEHYVGASDASTSVEGTIRHILESIRDGFALDDLVPHSEQELDEAFLPWLYRLDHLARERGRTAVIFIDAVDNLDERGRSMAWLPEHLPSTLRIVLTSRPGLVADIIAARGVTMLAIDPIDDPMTREAIVEHYLRGYRKRIDPAEMRRLVMSASAGSPLFLRVVAEELRMHGTHETIGDVIDRYAAAVDVDELFTLVLDRMERDFGRIGVETLLGLLFASRNGLAEQELLEISELTRVDLSRLLFALDYHLIHHDGLLGFFHDHLRSAVEQRYLADREVLRERHRQLGEYFAAQPADARRRAEEPWQWSRAEDARRLVAALTDAALFEKLSDARVRHELIGYWRALAPEHDSVIEYRAMLERMRRDRITAARRVELTEAVADYLVASARFGDAEALLRVAYRYRRLTLGTDAPPTIHAADLLATAIYHAGRYSESEALWLACLEALERSRDADDPALCGILDSLASCAHRRGDGDAMATHSNRSLAISTATYGRQHAESIARLMNVGEVELFRERYDEAVGFLGEAVNTARRAYGDRHPVTASCRTELGFAFRGAGRLKESVEILEEAAERTEELLGDHINLARVLMMLGTSIALDDDPLRAESIFKRAYELRVALQGEDHPETMVALSRIAIAVRRSGRPAEAEAIVRGLLPRQIDLLGPRDEGVRQTIFALINILHMTARDSEAELWQRRYDAADASIE